MCKSENSLMNIPNVKTSSICNNNLIMAAIEDMVAL